jgi:hypothetical protein
VVFPAGQASIDARGTVSHIQVSWWSPNQLILRRKTPGQTWGGSTYGSCCGSSPFIDTNALLETVYLYRMEGHDGSFSQADVGMRITFTNDPLAPGTAIKATHIQEIVRAANIVRNAANLSAFVLTATPGGPVMNAAQMNALRSSINAARVSLGATAFAFTGTIAPNTPILASHVQELREAIR